MTAELAPQGRSRTGQELQVDKVPESKPRDDLILAMKRKVTPRATDAAPTSGEDAALPLPAQTEHQLGQDRLPLIMLDVGLVTLFVVGFAPAHYCAHLA